MMLAAKLVRTPRTVGFSDEAGLGSRVVRENVRMQKDKAFAGPVLAAGHAGREALRLAISEKLACNNAGILSAKSERSPVQRRPPSQQKKTATAGP